MKRIAIIGAGGQGREVYQLIRQINDQAQQWECIGWFDDGLDAGVEVNGLPVLGGVSRLNTWEESIAVVVAVGWPVIKQRILGRIRNSNVYFPTLVHPSVIIDPEEVTIGEGTIITQGCILSVNINIGRHVLINFGCILTHDCLISDYCALMPSVNVSGEVVIGKGAYIGTGAKIIQQRRIGIGSIIGAGAVVTEDIPSRCTAVGIPARPIKFHAEEEEEVVER